MAVDHTHGDRPTTQVGRQSFDAPLNLLNLLQDLGVGTRPGDRPSAMRGRYQY